MQINELRLEQETRFRDFINQFLKNIEQDCDEEWWSDPSAARALSRLAGSDQGAVSDSLELHMEEYGNLVTAVWSGGTDIQGLERLVEDIKERLEKMAEAKKAEYGQRQDKRLKLEIHFLFFTKDFKSRIALEMKFNSKMKDSLRKMVLKKYAVPVTFEYTFVVYQEYCGKLARIRGINRHDSLQMPPISGRSNTEVPEKPADDTLRSTVVTVQLKQLVELYNQVGDQLFKNNVRFGIGEAFDVSKAMRKTLQEEPQRFWFKNNGVTLLVEDPSFRLDCPDELRLGRLEAGCLPQFSIVNGAQTITISAKYIFEQEYLKQDMPDQKELYEKRIKDFERAQVILRVIHVPIRQEQDETDGERAEIQAAKDLANDISVSLNRQKPIRQEDIAFATPFVQKLTEYLGEAQNGVPFQLVRRGEESGRISQLNLVDFSRARLACAGQPGKARTASSGEIMKMDLSTETFQNTNIFVESWTEPEVNEGEVFRRYYGAVWFADQIAKIYVKTMKSYRSENANMQTAVQNGKWYFTALVVQLLNQFKTDEYGQPDFSAFNWSAQPFAGIIPQAMEFFSRMVVICAGEGCRLDSNHFKKEEYYEQLVAELKKEKKDGPFKEFSELFFPVPEDKLPVTQNPKQQKITAVALGKEGRYIPVQSGKEAFEITVCYILQHFSPDPAQLAQYDSWLTANPQKAASRKGNFAFKHVSVVYRGQKYWIGSATLSNEYKFSHVRSLCRLAQVPQGEISWLADKEICFKW